MSFKKFVFGSLGAGLVTLITGCASAPGPVSADVPLVHGNYASDVVSERATIAPATPISAGNTIELDGISWQIGKPYHSAAKQLCHPLYPAMQEQAALVAPTLLCQSPSGWVKYASVLSVGA